MTPYSRYTTDGQTFGDDDDDDESPTHSLGSDGRTIEDWRTQSTLPSYGSASQYRSFDGAPIYEPRGRAF